MWHRSTHPLSVESSGGHGSNGAVSGNLNHIRRLVIKQEVTEAQLNECEDGESTQSRIREEFGNNNNNETNSSKYCISATSQGIVAISDNEMYQNTSSSSSSNGSGTPSSVLSFSTSTPSTINGNCIVSGSSVTVNATSSGNSTSNSVTVATSHNSSNPSNNGNSSLSSSVSIGVSGGICANEGATAGLLEGKHLDIQRGIPPPYAPRRPKIPLMNWNHVPSVRIRFLYKHIFKR